MAEYHKLKLEISELEKKMMAEITKPERALYFLLPGRLVCGEAMLYSSFIFTLLLDLSLVRFIYLG